MREGGQETRLELEKMVGSSEDGGCDKRDRKMGAKLRVGMVSSIYMKIQ